MRLNMPISNETSCPECGKLIALFEKPTNPRRLVGACNCAGRLREVIEIDNEGYLSEEEILEPAEPASSIVSVSLFEKEKLENEVTPPADKRKRRK